MKKGVAEEFATSGSSGRTAGFHAAASSGTQSGSTLPVAGFGREQLPPCRVPRAQGSLNHARGVRRRRQGVELARRLLCLCRG